MDPVIDMLIGIKNAHMARKEQVSVPFSKIKFTIAKILKEAGYVDEVERKSKKTKKGELDYLTVTLKIADENEFGLKIVSRPSRRIYIKAKDIRKVRSGYGIAIISTSKGIMTADNARKNGLGGQVICEVW